MKKGKKQNFSKGITMVALVLTIVVLIILSAVTIATLTGDNGILNKAKEAAEKTKESTEEENRILNEIYDIMQDTTGGGNDNPDENVTAVKIVSNPQNIETIIGGKDVSFSVEATGAGEITYQWYVNEINSTDGGTLINGATNNTYTILADQVTDDDNGKYYYCKVTQEYINKITTVTSNTALLTVGTRISVGNPEDVVVIEGQTAVSFTVTATGSGTFTYQWYINNKNSNADETPISGATSSTYTIPAAEVTTSLDGKYYSCKVTQEYAGSTSMVESGRACLNVAPKAYITKQPSSVSTIAGEEDVSYSISTTGLGITYQWYRNTSNSNSGGTAISGATSSTYTIPASSVTSSISGNYYYCVLTQNIGSSTYMLTSDTASLSVISEVIITKQPSSTIIGYRNDSTPITLTVEASGAGILSYQWYYYTTSPSMALTVPNGTSATLSFDVSDLQGYETTTNYTLYCIVSQEYGDSIFSTRSNNSVLTLYAEKVYPQVGDYVNYTPDIATSAQLTQLNSDINSKSGTSTTQSLTQTSELKWKIMEINSSTKMPTRLISEKETDESLTLQGSIGSSNVNYLVTNASKILYSKDGIGDATGISAGFIEEFGSSSKIKEVFYKGITNDYWTTTIKSQMYPGGATYPMARIVSSTGISDKAMREPSTSGDVDKTITARLRPMVILKSGVKANYAGTYKVDAYETYNVWNLSN